MDFSGLNGLPYLSNVDVTLIIFTGKTVFYSIQYKNLLK